MIWLRGDKQEEMTLHICRWCTDQNKLVCIYFIQQEEESEEPNDFSDWLQPSEKCRIPPGGGNTEEKLTEVKWSLQKFLQETKVFSAPSNLSKDQEKKKKNVAQNKRVLFLKNIFCSVHNKYKS